MRMQLTAAKLLNADALMLDGPTGPLGCDDMSGSRDVLNMSAEDSPQQAHQTNIAIKEDSLSQDEIDRMTQEQKSLYQGPQDQD